MIPRVKKEMLCTYTLKYVFTVLFGNNVFLVIQANYRKDGSS